MNLLDTIEGCQILEWDDSSVHYTAKAAIDGDGAGARHGDPCYQGDTSLHYEGKALNSDTDLYIAISPDVCKEVKGIVLGCQANIYNRHTKKNALAVVADIGPHRKIGEISICLARALDIPSSPTSGGDDVHEIEYILYPGQPARLQGRQYHLTAV